MGFAPTPKPWKGLMLLLHHIRVPKDGIEPPTPTSSGLRSTNELLGCKNYGDTGYSGMSLPVQRILWMPIWLRSQELRLTARLMRPRWPWASPHKW